MKWNVYIYNINKNKIELFNIFDHIGFLEDVKKDIKKYKNKEEFEDKLKRELFYYFWSKCEWELIIEITKDNHILLSPWCGCRNPEEAKVDITNKSDFDWRSFANEHTKKQIYGNEAKIDVFDQVMMNFDVFVDYVWKNRKEISKL